MRSKGRRKANRLWGVGQSRSNRIEVHISHARHDRRLIQERLTLIAPFPKLPRAIVFGVGLPSDTFRQRPQAAEAAER